MPFLSLVLVSVLVVAGTVLVKRAWAWRSWQSRFMAGLDAYRGARYGEALEHLDAALSRARRLGGELEPMGETLGLIALAAIEHGRLDQAEAAYRRSLDLHQKVLGADHPETALVRGGLAAVLDAVGRGNEAEDLLRGALPAEGEVREGRRAVAAFRDRAALGGLLRRQGRRDEAQRILRECASGLPGDVPDRDDELAGIVFQLAEIYLDQGELASAEGLYYQALSLWQGSRNDTRRFVAGCLAGLARVLARSGRHLEAEALHQEVVAEWERIHGQTHPSLAKSLHELADFYFGRGDFARSEACQRKAVEVLERCLGSDHPELAGSLEDHAQVLREVRRFDEAQAVAARARELRGRRR